MRSCDGLMFCLSLTANLKSINQAIYAIRCQFMSIFFRLSRLNFVYATRSYRLGLNQSVGVEMLHEIKWETWRVTACFLSLSFSHSLSVSCSHTFRLWLELCCYFWKNCAAENNSWINGGPSVLHLAHIRWNHHSSWTHRSLKTKFV